MGWGQLAEQGELGTASPGEQLWCRAHSRAAVAEAIRGGLVSLSPQPRVGWGCTVRQCRMVPCLQNGPCVLLCSALLEQGLEYAWAFGGISVTATALKGHLPLAVAKVGICLSGFPATVPLSLSVGTSEAAGGQGGFRARPGAQPAHGMEQERSRERGLSQDRVHMPENSRGSHQLGFHPREAQSPSLLSSSLVLPLANLPSLSFSKFQAHKAQHLLPHCVCVHAAVHV